MFDALMKKLQPEGKYLSFERSEYDKAIKATAVVKIIPTEIWAKFKFGQHLNKEHFGMILKHLEEHGEIIDLDTIVLMKSLRGV